MNMNAPAPGRMETEFVLPVGFTDEEGKSHRTVVLRKMTGKEEAILADRRNQRNGGKLVTELLHSCLVRLADHPKNGPGPIENMCCADGNFMFSVVPGPFLGRSPKRT